MPTAIAMQTDWTQPTASLTQSAQNLDATLDAALDAAIDSSQRYLLSLQHSEGYWWGDLESNVSITAEMVLLHKIWGTDSSRPLAKMAVYLRAQQRSHGGWELFYGDGGELSVSVEAYMALRLLGVPASDPDMQRARAFILAQGGIGKTRIFTKFHLALIGCYDWRGLPSIPAAIMLLPDWFPVNIYEMSSWARGSTVPLLIVFDRQPVYVTEPAIRLDELYVGAVAPAEFTRSGDWSDLFIELDGWLKRAADWNLMPFRAEGIRAAERWILERQEQTGDWAGIIPAMLNSMLALRALNYSVNDISVTRGLAAIDRFGVETEAEYWTQPCVSPVWDTALVMRALSDSGLPADHPALRQAADWLLRQQILSYGDWAVKNRSGKPGGWAFEFVNQFYPDVDDTAVVVMALQAAPSSQPQETGQAIERALQWIASMQCSEGGWAAFDLDNNQDWLNAMPYGDLKAMIDPNTADVTARVLEMVGRLGQTNLGQASLSQSAAFAQADLNRALLYLRQQQEPEGCWFGRWGVNYIYGTSSVLTALALLVPQTYRDCIERGAAWLASCQNPDGGWGETGQSYRDPTLKGQGPSTPSQTAWAVMGLLAAGGFEAATRQGIRYLLSSQNPDGSWDEIETTGTGFPGHFYLNYHLYRQHFPLTALGRYRAAASG